MPKTNSIRSAVSIEHRLVTDRHRPMASTVSARERCRISPPRLLAECCKRQLNQGSFVLLYFRLSTFSDLFWVCLSVFSCTVLFVSISQVIGCEDRLRNDIYCVEWGVKLYSNQPTEAKHRAVKTWHLPWLTPARTVTANYHNNYSINSVINEHILGTALITDYQQSRD